MVADLAAATARFSTGVDAASDGAAQLRDAVAGAEHAVQLTAHARTAHARAAADLDSAEARRTAAAADLARALEDVGREAEQPVVPRTVYVPRGAGGHPHTVDSVATITTLIDVDPAVLHSFVRWHRAVGVSRIYLFFDDAQGRDAAAFALAEGMAGVVAVDAGPQSHVREHRWPQECSLFPSVGPHVDAEVMARQQLNAELAARDAAASGDVDWLAHIDFDELIVVGDGQTLRPFVDHIGRVLSTLEEAEGGGGGGGAGVGPPRSIVLVNHEAVPEHFGDVAAPFVDVTLFKRNPVAAAIEGVGGRAGTDFWRRRTRALVGRASVFNCYENGKSIVRLRTGYAVPSGVHRWASQPAPIAECAVVEPRAACILHFANCGLSSWLQKYATLGHFADRWFRRRPITLRFHLRARDAVQRALAADASGEAEKAGARALARALYEGSVVLADPEEVRRQLAPDGACVRFRVVAAVLAAAAEN